MSSFGESRMILTGKNKFSSNLAVRETHISETAVSVIGMKNVLRGQEANFMVLKEHVGCLHKIKPKSRGNFPKIYNFDAL